MEIKWVHNTIPKEESNLKISKNSDKDNSEENESEKEQETVAEEKSSDIREYSSDETCTTVTFL